MSSLETWLARGVQAAADGAEFEAVAAFRQALALDPSAGEAWLGLGLSLMKRGHVREASDALNKACHIPDPPALWLSCLGQAQYGAGDFAKSASSFQRAAAKGALPQNAVLTWARAALLEAALEDQVAAGLERYSILAKEAGESVEGVLHEALLLLKHFDHPKAAAEIGRELLMRAPENAVYRYEVEALKPQAVERAPTDYIETKFDAFAERYDAKMIERLAYDVPEHLAAMLRAIARPHALALDLGCGTGLMVAALGGDLGHVTGVDISTAMLGLAAARGGYDTLIHDDILEYCTRNQSAFDLVLAADVLIYFGALDKLFTEIHRILAPGGHFVFSVERGDEAWTLKRTGRFSHSLTYLQALAAARFEIVDSRVMQIRTEGACAVLGLLQVWRRL